MNNQIYLGHPPSTVNLAQGGTHRYLVACVFFEINEPPLLDSADREREILKSGPLRLAFKWKGSDIL